MAEAVDSSSSRLGRAIVVTARAAGLAVLAVVVAVAGRIALLRFAESRINRTHRPPPYAASAEALELHRTLTVVDLHADSLLWGRDLLRRSRVGHVDMPRLIAGGIGIQALSACVRVPRGLNVERNEDRGDMVLLLALIQGWPRSTWGSGLARALHLARRAREMAARSEGRFAVLTSRAELHHYLERRGTDRAITAGLLTIEGGSGLDDDPANVDVLADAGFRILAPTHMFDNVFAGSASGVAKGGLTPSGRRLIERLEARSILVDLAHASVATIDDVLAIATRPVVASHTGVRGTCETIRNLSDDHVRAIAATGGVVGIGFWPTVCCGDDARAIARSIAHAVSIGGLDHVALGSDFDGAVPVPFDATGMVQVTDALLAEGFGHSDVAAIMGGNAVRVLRECLPD